MDLKAADLAERLSVMGFRDTSQQALAALYCEAGTDAPSLLSATRAAPSLKPLRLSRLPSRYLEDV